MGIKHSLLIRRILGCILILMVYKFLYLPRITSVCITDKWVRLPVVYLPGHEAVVEKGADATEYVISGDKVYVIKERNRGRLVSKTFITYYDGGHWKKRQTTYSHSGMRLNTTTTYSTKEVENKTPIPISQPVDISDMWFIASILCGIATLIYERPRSYRIIWFLLGAITAPFGLIALIFVKPRNTASK